MPYMSESLTMKQGTGSYETRNNDLFFGLKVFLKSPFVGFGLNNHEYQQEYAEAFGMWRHDSNGMINILISTGILGGIIVFRYFCFLLKWFKTYLSKYITFGLIIWFVVSLNTEPIAFHPFFYFLIGVGLSFSSPRAAIKRHF